MKASELIEILKEHPDAEVVIEGMGWMGIVTADRAEVGYFTAKDRGFYFGLEELEYIEPNLHPVKGVLIR